MSRVYYTITDLSAGVFPMGQNEDRPVPIDLSLQLAVGEPITNPACRLWLLDANGHATESEKASLLSGTPVVAGNVVSQRVAGLTAGRAYRLVVTHGSTGNRRSAEVTIPVVV